MESRVGRILLTISAVLTFIIALALLVFTIAIPFLPQEQVVNDKILATVLFAVFFVVLIALGVLKLWAARLMRESETTKKGGVIALVVGIIGMDVFALAGAFFAITYAERSEMGVSNPQKPVAINKQVVSQRPVIAEPVVKQQVPSSKTVVSKSKANFFD